MTDPHHGYNSPEFDEAGDIHAHGGQSQFPSPPKKPIAGAYERHDYAPRGKFGPREAGSTAAFATIMAGPIAFAAMRIEQHAEALGQSPEQAMGFAGGVFASSFAMAIVWKIVASLLRNFGESMVRNIAAWVWMSLGSALWSMATGWLPWKQDKPPIWDRIKPTPDPAPEPNRPIIDWINNRRKRRNQ